MFTDNIFFINCNNLQGYVWLLHYMITDEGIDGNDTQGS